MAVYRGDDNAHNQIIRELGEQLKSIREAQGLFLDTISDITKIQKRYLQAIEEGDISKLPKGPYVRGFIRQYCEFLNAMDLWDSYDALTQSPAAQETSEPERDYIAAPRIFRASSHWWIYLIVLVSLASAGWITWHYRGEITGISTSPVGGGTAAVSKDRRETEAAAPGDTALSADGAASVDLSWMDGRPAAKPADSTTDAAQTTAASSPEPAANTAARESVPTAKNVLRIEATASVWLSVTSGEQSLYRGTIKSGESKTFTVGGKAVRVRYGNPAGAAVTWNGTRESQLGPAAKPLTRVYHPDGRVTGE